MKTRAHAKHIQGPATGRFVVRVPSCLANDQSNVSAPLLIRRLFNFKNGASEVSGDFPLSFSDQPQRKNGKFVLTACGKLVAASAKEISMGAASVLSHFFFFIIVKMISLSSS